MFSPAVGKICSLWVVKVDEAEVVWAEVEACVYARGFTQVTNFS